MAENNTISVNVGVILQDLNSEVEKIWLSCIKMALSDFYASHPYYSTRLVLNTRESKENVVSAASSGNFITFRFQLYSLTYLYHLI